MEMWSEVRRRVLVEGVSRRQIRREYRIGSETLAKMLANPEPPGYRLTAARSRPKLGAFTAVIDEILVSDLDAPPKQRHTGRRIFERLRDEWGYRGGITQVRDYVAERQRHSREVFVPLSHPAGEAQFDFGEATVVIAGVRAKAAFAVMTLPFSDAWHMSAYPRECTETFQAAHVAAFEFFGGVPTRTSYDNTTIAVKKVVGRERELTREFLRLESHFLFKHHFCRVARGNEKGHVESLVGYGRRNTMVPVPEFASFTALNDYLAACCIGDLNRRVRGKPEIKAERLEIDRAAMLPLPSVAFEARRVVAAKANSLSLVRFDRNDYSVPTACAHHDVTAIGSIDDVRIVVGTEVVARHRRCWSKEQTTYDPRHYLALLERKPGALDVARPLERWDLPACFAILRRRLEADLGSVGTREFIKVLRLLESASLRELTRAVNQAISIGATGADAVALILAHSQEKPVGLFSLDGHPHLKSVVIDPLDLGAYRVLTQIGA
jgi:transposase